MSDPAARAVDAVDAYLRAAEFSGIVRIDHRGETLLAHASGFANRSDRVPNEISTRFGLASLTKTFTSAAVCRLVAAGHAGFDSQIVQILPSDRRPTRMSEEVTLHHLLTHTSGIADYYDEVTLGAAAYDQVWIEHISYLFTEPKDFLPLFAHLEPLRPPGGAVASYCNAGYIVLGLVIEELSGKSYASYVEDEIFGSCGMNDSGFFRLDDVRERVAIGYVATGDGWKTNQYSIPVKGGPDGGAYSNAADLVSFLRCLEDGTLFGSSTWSGMCTPHVRMEEVGYGYGLVVTAHGGHVCFGHGGADPGFGARAYRYPEIELDVVVLGNTIDEPDPVIETFRTALGE